MPFDGTVNTPALNRARLVDALRNDTEWRWNFCRSSGCAIGMAQAIWGEELNLCDHLGLTVEQYENIFGFIRHLEPGRSLEWCDLYGMARPEVTPQMVADALERV